MISSFILPKFLSFVIPIFKVVKVLVASVVCVVFIDFAGITLAESAVALAITTPLFIIFSPILVPATIATSVLTTGFTAGASLGETAIGLIFWLIKHRMGAKPKDNPPPEGAPPMLPSANKTLMHVRAKPLGKPSPFGEGHPGVINTKPKKKKGGHG